MKKREGFVSMLISDIIGDSNRKDVPRFTYGSEDYMIMPLPGNSTHEMDYKSDCSAKYVYGKDGSESTVHIGSLCCRICICRQGTVIGGVTCNASNIEGSNNELVL